MKRFFQFTHWAMETLRGKNRGERGILPRRGGVDRFTTHNGTRSLRMESLEERQLLSVTPTEYAEIRSTYAEFGLAENMDEINLIEITKLSTANLKAAIETASQTESDDLIVIRTTESASSIIFTREANEIKISLDSSAKGTLSIVGYGDAPLSINANNKCRAITVESGTVNFGNILLKNGSTSGYGEIGRAHV